MRRVARGHRVRVELVHPGTNVAHDFENTFTEKLAKKLEFGTKNQGCQMEYFLTENPNFDKCWNALVFRFLMSFMAIW
jgi:hypothetical protein